MNREYHKKTCSCGCGETFTPTGSRQKCIKGHFKKQSVEDEPRDPLISNIMNQKPPRHEFSEYEDKDTAGKRLDSVCVRAFMSAGQIALKELGMTSITIEKNGMRYEIRRLLNEKA